MLTSSVTKCRFTNPAVFFPVRLIDEPAFGEPPWETLEGAIFTAQFGLRQRPQLSSHNVQRTNEAKGTLRGMVTGVARIAVISMAFSSHPPFTRRAIHRR